MIARLRAAALALLAVTVTVGAPGALPAASAAQTAAPARVFDAGLIISDSNFFDYPSMTAAGVQGFLEDTTCTPKDTAPCLRDYRQDTTTQDGAQQPGAGPGHCARYAGARHESASRIIWRVAQACKISPRVLLVLLQKEQSLVTRPSAYGYQRATGYGCPDSADCDREYFGFFNQVYHAARQFRRYTQDPGWRYHVGSVAVQYNPDAACGSSVVSIRNQATANLYNYTPYQPNALALADADGSGAPCATYGNLNFFRIYSAWFGDPLSVRFGGWWPDCLDFVGGKDCTFASPFVASAVAR